MNSKNPFILASASPRRAELLRAAGIAFTVFISPAHEPEHKPAAIPVELWPMCLAYMKATAVQNNLEARKAKYKTPVILAADTIVVLGEGPSALILNKARNRAHARRMLSSLRGKIHRVISGIAILRGDAIRLASATATCRMKNISPAALEQYLDSGLWKGKAGAYGIQDTKGGDPFITLLSGDITTVIGLPMKLVQSELAFFR